MDRTVPIEAGDVEAMLIVIAADPPEIKAGEEAGEPRCGPQGFW